MNTAIARRIVEETTQLTELVAVFQARYGKTYRLKPGSPAEAWTLHRQILDQQRAIAGLLDADVIEQPVYKHIRWWQQQEAMDTGVTQDLFFEAYQLVTRCAFTEANAHDLRRSPGIACSQAVIAGMLHPVALQDPKRNIYAA
ncbi:MAG: hypothetical protein U0694_21455 [Anaerolineae bacterium]